jgi:hypothetical protein
MMTSFLSMAQIKLMNVWHPLEEVLND